MNCALPMSLFQREEQVMKNEVELPVDGRIISIPVTPTVKAYFNSQFKTNTPLRKQRYTTLINLIRAAYKKGLQDAGK